MNEAETRAERISRAEATIFALLNDKHIEFGDMIFIIDTTGRKMK